MSVPMLQSEPTLSLHCLCQRISLAEAIILSEKKKDVGIDKPYVVQLSLCENKA